jgi:Ala-tRNA(Pro) deacylase
MRVTQFLADQHVAYEEMLHAPAFNSQKLAKSLHISGRQVVKSVLLKGPKGFFLAVLPAASRIDFARLAKAMNGAVRLATEAELIDQFLDCEWGAVMPFGRLYELQTVLDATIALDATIVFQAQRHMVAIKMLCRDFVKLERPERLLFAGPALHARVNRPTAWN